MHLRFSTILQRLTRRRGKVAFLQSLPVMASVLDVGCGNSSPMKAKTQRPDLVYVGLDVGDYNQTCPEQYADTYYIVPATEFSTAIDHFADSMDAVISSHNIEHCVDPGGVIQAMLAAIKPGGTLYMAFPCEESVQFPSRRESLNFFDDKTHSKLPRWNEILCAIQGAGFKVDFSAKRYRPLFLAFCGILSEPASAFFKKANVATWALYGFESVIWASRPKSIV